ncbi:MAG TPA: substrate-binding domain-containing protein [Methylibium sp.]
MLRPLLPVLLSASLCLFATVTPAAEIGVASSGGFAAAFKTLASRYEAGAPNRGVRRIFGPSMGNTPEAVPARLARGEEIDVVIMVGEALDQLMARGLLEPGSKVLLAQSRIACAVPAGASRPRLGSEDEVRQAFLQAPSVAWSDSASGEYIQKTLLARLGIESEVRAKGRQIPGTPVGEIVARREAMFGCQQRSELRPVAGIDIVGDLPDALQKVTPFAAAVVRGSRHPQDARAFIDFLASPGSAPLIEATGLAPAPH